MELSLALILYAVILFVSFFVLLYFNYTAFSAFMLALIVSIIFLNIAFPLSRNEIDDINSLTMIYILVQTLTLLVFILYAFISSVKDLRNTRKYPMRRLV